MTKKKHKRKPRTKKNAPKTRAGKTGRWMKVKAVKVVRNKGKLTVIVKK